QQKTRLSPGAQPQRAGGCPCRIAGRLTGCSVLVTRRSHGALAIRLDPLAYTKFPRLAGAPGNRSLGRRPWACLARGEGKPGQAAGGGVVVSGTWRSRKPRTRFSFPPSLSSPAGFLGAGFPEPPPASSTARTEQRSHATLITSRLPAIRQRAIISTTPQSSLTPINRSSSPQQLLLFPRRNRHRPGTQFPLVGLAALPARINPDQNSLPLRLPTPQSQGIKVQWEILLEVERDLLPFPPGLIDCNPPAPLLVLRFYSQIPPVRRINKQIRGPARQKRNRV